MLAPAGAENVARVEFSKNNTAALWLDVLGTKYAITQYSASFAVNEIPQATCMLATGESFAQVNNGLTSGDALASTQTGAGLEKAKAKVYLNLDSSMWDPVTRELWGGGDKVIFEGYLVGISYHRIDGQIQLSVNLLSELIDLTCGTIFSDVNHPSNPLDFTQDAGIDLASLPCANVGGAGAAGQVAWDINAMFGGGVPPAENCHALAGANVPELGCKLVGALTCCSALDLFRIKCPDNVTASDQNRAAAPLLAETFSDTGRLRPPLDREPWRTAFTSYISNSLNQYRGSTFWDMLVRRWCPEFQLTFVPLPGTDGGTDKAGGRAFGCLVPAWPTYRFAFKTLYLNDYADFQLNTQQHRPLANVGVLTPWQSTTGAVPANNKEGERQCVSGIYPGPVLGQEVQGQFLLIDAPGWLQNVLYTTNGAARLAQGVNTAVDPNDGMGDRDHTFESIKLDMSQILDDYAESFYSANFWRGRTGRFSSKLRFDICPGSILKLSKDKNPFAGVNVGAFGVSVGFGGSNQNVKSLPEDLYGHVSRVTYNINSQSPMAQTVFDLSAVRNEEENSDGPTVTKHPYLDQTKWNGMELIRGWGF